MIKLFIADDNSDFRSRIRNLIEDEEGMKIVGDAPDAAYIVREVKASQADVVIMDVSMPGINGLDAAKALKKVLPALKIIIVSVYDIKEYKDAAFDAGAAAYMVKKDLITQLVPKIREVTGIR